MFKTSLLFGRIGHCVPDSAPLQPTGQDDQQSNIVQHLVNSAPSLMNPEHIKTKMLLFSTKKKSFCYLKPLSRLNVFCLVFISANPFGIFGVDLGADVDKNALAVATVPTRAEDKLVRVAREVLCRFVANIVFL